MSIDPISLTEITIPLLSQIRTKTFQDADISILDKQLETLPTQEILKLVWKIFGLKAVASSSFQTQSLPLLHMISQVCPRMRILFVDTGFHFADTLGYLERLRSELGLQIVVVRPFSKDEFEDLQQDIPLYRFDPDLCCQIHKVEPFMNALKGADVLISGVRRDQTARRSQMQTVQHTDERLLRIHPMLSWTENQVMEYIFAHGLPVHPLYSQRYRSIGCAPCTRPVAIGENSRSGRWSGLSKEECGLHMPSDSGSKKATDISRRFIGSSQDMLISLREREHEQKEKTMKKEIRIGKRQIGELHPSFIVAEVGVTCNYDMQITKDLIDVVSETGADAIKLIFWFPEEIMSDKSISYSYETTTGQKSESMFDMLNELRFSLDEWHDVKSYADKRDIVLFSTVNSPSGIDYSEALGLEAYKLSSWDYNYLPLWRRIAAIGKPMLIDTGPVNTLEVAKVMQLMQEAKNDQSVLVHCLHTDNHNEMNMRAIPYMKKTFNTLVGYSSKDLNDETDIMALTLGAVVLEKRLTMDRNLPGHHHILSKTPHEFEEYVKLMRNVHSALGEFDLRPSVADLVERNRWFRHLVANQEIPKGTLLSREMIEGKRPEDGISPEYIDFFIGRITRRDLEYNETLSWDDV